jgi:hypothetical protein
MQLVTRKCGRFNHPEFHLEADEAIVPDVYLRKLIETIEGMVAEGSVFKPGETFQIGWMITQVQPFDGSHLTLVEPDMKSFPIKWVPGVTHTLRQQMVQLFMLDSVSLREEMEIPTVLQSLVACTRYESSCFFMSMSESSNPNDSGWFVGCREDHDHNNPKNLRCISVYEAFLHQPGIQGFMTFPRNSVIAVEPGKGITIFHNEEKLKIKKGSFLDSWLKQQGK